MFQKKTDINATALKMEIDALFDDMSKVDRTSKEYAAMATQLNVLYKLRETDGNVKSKKNDSNVAWASIAANLAGIAIITDFERARVITTKALAFLPKLR